MSLRIGSCLANLALLLLISAGQALAQLLSPGDLAIVGLNMDDPNEISFVALVDIRAGTELRFTNNGWTATGEFREEEDTMIWTPTQDILRGRVVVLNGTDGRVPGLAAAGDQLFAYQVAGDGTIRFIYGVNNTPVGGWQDDAFTDQETTLPAQLLDSFTAVSLPHCDNVIYTGISDGRQAELLIHIANPAGWLCNNNAHFALGSHPFSVTGVLNSLPTFTSVLPDTTIRVGQTLDFRYQASDPEGQVILYSGQVLPPGAVIAATNGVVRWVPAENQIGSHTFTVQASDGVSAATVSAVVTVVSGTASVPGWTSVDGTTVAVYPNPASDAFTIRHPPLADVLVTDVLGRVMHRSSEADTETAVRSSRWSPGMYLVRITTRHRVETRTVLIR